MLQPLSPVPTPTAAAQRAPMMKIYGIDFTSAPNSKKAITYAQCVLSEKGLFLESLGCLTSFDAFESFLRQPGPWVGGMDFPFGQPRKLIENLQWPKTWDGYVGCVAEMTKVQFVNVLTNYCNSRNKGDKHHLRVTDKLANSRSPMMLYRVPVAKMFFAGATRLLNAGSTFSHALPEMTRVWSSKLIPPWVPVAGLVCIGIKLML